MTNPEPAQKQCPGCGEMFERKSWQTHADFRRRTYCSQSCAAKYTHAGRPRKTKPPETKLCVACGAVIVRDAHASNPNWRRRRYCSRSCASSFARRPDAPAAIRYLSQFCDCGEPRTGVIWIVQLSGEGHESRECVEVCDACRDMWLELDPGASLEEPPSKQQSSTQKVMGAPYFAPAHMAQRNFNGDW